jgi:uncharacterized protein (DUF2336 family)
MSAMTASGSASSSTTGPGQSRYDSLLFAAAGAFVALPRPGREDAERLDALAAPLYGHLSDEGKRLTAAVLSEARSVIPERLVAALAMEPLSISASLLISRAEIPDSVLAAVIAERGPGHARIIAMRKSIGDTMQHRIDQLIEEVAPLAKVEITDTSADAEPQADGPVRSALQAAPHFDPLAEGRLDAVSARDALRRMMMRQTLRPDLATRMVVDEGPERNLVARLINLALTGDPDLLATSVADELRLPFAPVRRLVRRKDTHEIMLLLKAMELGPTDCFAILAALRPLSFATVEAIARFHLSFQSADDATMQGLMSAIVRQAAPAAAAARG